MQPLILSLLLAGGFSRSDTLASTLREAMHPEYLIKLDLDRVITEHLARSKVLRATRPVNLDLLIANARQTQALLQHRGQLLAQFRHYPPPFPWKQPRAEPARPADGGP